MSQPETKQLTDAEELDQLFDADKKRPKPIGEDLVQIIADKFNELCKLLAENNIAICEIDAHEKILNIQKLSQRNFKKYLDMGCYFDFEGEYTVSDVNSTH